MFNHYPIALIWCDFTWDNTPADRPTLRTMSSTNLKRELERHVGRINMAYPLRLIDDPIVLYYLQLKPARQCEAETPTSKFPSKGGRDDSNHIHPSDS
jgi:hypothetical protein